MQSNKLIDALETLSLDASTIKQIPVDTNIQGFSQDSRDLNAQTVFVALYGHQSNGHDYLENAAKAGCKLALLDTTIEAHHSKLSSQEPGNMLCISVFNLHKKLPRLAAAFYQSDINNNSFPQIAAVTGTNGKTSVVTICAQLASLCACKSASIGTMGVFIYENGQPHKQHSTLNTTPDLLSLYNRINELSKQGCKYIYIEASSHGLENGKLAGIAITHGVFTNISQDHLDFHKNMSAYSAAKRKLITQEQMQTLVLNADDPESLNWSTQVFSNQRIFYYATSALSKDKKGCWAEHIEATNKGLRFTLHLNNEKANASAQNNQHKHQVDLALIGKFNVENTLASVCLLFSQGFDYSLLLAQLNQLSGVPGRMELFLTNKASILVDYAHTPDALAKALSAARLHSLGKLICVFGCGGDRDTSKRAIMGAQASKLADRIVITQDNARSEDPQSIIDDICEGIDKQYLQQNVHIQLDRQQAIFTAWMNSESEDIILLAGKGHEEYIEVNHEKRPYVERDFVADIVNLGENAIAKANPSLWSTQESASL